ncbi:MAG: hypothetical protein Q9166_002860 [cf. Caloplaca sp. 2 TL-2023]
MMVRISAADSPISANTTARLLVACNAGQANSTCCKGDETCGPDLLCTRSDGTKARQYCTDKTWTTDQCSPLCPGYDEAGVILTTCSDGTYCCGFDNTECCDKGEGYRINPRNGQILIQGQITSSARPASSTRTSSSSSSSSTSTSTSTASTTDPAAAQPASTGANNLPSPIATPSGLSGGAKAGIAVGAIAGAAIIAGLVFMLWRERKKRNALAESEKQTLGYGNGYYGHVPHEMPSQVAPVEMGAYEGNDSKYVFRGELEGARGELGGGQGKPSELHS